jgi:hypothetical protein
MTYNMIDVESDGPIPSDYSMVCFGAVVVMPLLDSPLDTAISDVLVGRRCA